MKLAKLCILGLSLVSLKMMSCDSFIRWCSTIKCCPTSKASQKITINIDATYVTATFSKQDLTITLFTHTDNEEIGYATATTISDTVADIQVVEVEAPYRNQGCGTKICTELINELKKLGYKKITLTAQPFTIIMTETRKRKAALGKLIKFYTALGFKLVKRDDIAQNASMELEIPQTSAQPSTARPTTAADNQLLSVVLAG